MKHLNLKSVADCVIPYWRKGLLAGKMLGGVDCMGARMVTSVNLGITSVVSNVS